MKERPILFSGAMVRAILAGRETQTRRVVKIPKVWPLKMRFDGMDRLNDKPTGIAYFVTEFGWDTINCPFGTVGDRLWVRETWAFESWEQPEYGTVSREMAMDACEPSMEGQQIQIGTSQSEKWFYKATDEYSGRWRPSIHMPRDASRITLEITGVRVERVQDAPDADLLSEGIEYEYVGRDQREVRRRAFANLWDSLNAARGFGWDKNPWVWVLEFKRLK